MKIAVAGCIHGNLDGIYSSLGILERQEDVRVSLLIICGDMLTIRNPLDIEAMTMPMKNKTVVSSFHKYYSGASVAPVLTIFVGGIYEVLSYTSELPYGGWVCPNVYYMGHANVLNVGGLRIAGLSSIFKDCYYRKGHYEYPPYKDSFKCSMLNVRNLDVFRLKQVERPIDIFVSHDWPEGVYHYGNKKAILSCRPDLKKHIEKSTLGSPASAELLRILKPSYWFAAGLHWKFVASVPHNDKKRPKTEFVAFDKCLPGRQFLQIFDINSKFKKATSKIGNIQIEYDPEWLGILRTTNHLLNATNEDTILPEIGIVEKWDFYPTRGQLKYVHKLFKYDFKVPENFCVTSPTYSSLKPFIHGKIKSRYVNSQTRKFCNIMKITNPLDAAISEALHGDDSSSDFSDDIFEEEIYIPNESTIVFSSDETICSNKEDLADIQEIHMSSIVSEEICIDASYQASQLSNLDVGKSGSTSNSSSSDPKRGWEYFTPQPSCSSSDPGTSSTACAGSIKQISCSPRKKSQGK